ncbi:MAG TPA: hypothetical protein VJR48_17575 [Ktedonobacterales bacterium]|jgi:hypothetical protein|nr:hypothetical protein [Ktedonobacterales bacterium]
MMNLLKHYRILATLLVALTVLATLAACATPSTGNTTGTGSPTAAATAQPTAKPTLKALPTITQALCQQLMTVAEANTMVQPPVPATSLVADHSEDGGSCNYLASQTRIPLIIYFFDWKGPVPIPQADIAAALAESSGSTKITINQATPVDGIGVQAEFVSLTATDKGFTGSATIFYVLEGPFFYDCLTFGPLTGGALGTQDQLQACASQVDSRLRQS